MHDARVTVADGSVHGHEPRHRHRAAIDGEPLLLPVDFGEQASEVRLARGGIEDLRDEHESGGQRHARSCTERARWARDLREAERIPRPREAAEAATDVLAGTAAGARGWTRLTQPSRHIPRVEAAMGTTIEETGGHRRPYLRAGGHVWFLPHYERLVNRGGGYRVPGA